MKTKILLLALAATLITGCNESERAASFGDNKPKLVRVFSGGVVVANFVATRSPVERNSGCCYFVNKATGCGVTVHGTYVVTQYEGAK